MRKKIFSVTINDCDVQTFASGGPGGQHQNKTQTGVRIIHRASGAIGESREYRSQLDNKRAAFKRMGETEKFKNWCHLEASRISGKPSIEEEVESMMKEENLKIEVLNENNKWVELKCDARSDGDYNSTGGSDF